MRPSDHGSSSHGKKFHPPRKSIAKIADPMIVGILRHEEDPELETTVFGVEAPDEIRLRLGHIEWKSVGLSKKRHEEDQRREAARGRAKHSAAPGRLQIDSCHNQTPAAAIKTGSSERPMASS